MAVLLALVAACLSLIALALVQASQARRERPYQWTVLLYAIRVFLSILFVISLGVVGFEIGIVRYLVDREIIRAVDYRANLQDTDYLRRKFSPEELRSFRLAITRTLGVRPAVPGEETLLDAYIYPVVDGPVRTDLRFERAHCLLTSATGEEYFEVTETVSFSLHVGENTKTVRLPLWQMLEPIGGVADDSLFALKDFRINNEKVPAELRIAKVGDKIVFDGTQEVPITTTSHWYFAWIKRIPVDDDLTSLMSFPTKGAEVTFRYPGVNDKTFDPKFFLFGVAGETPELAPVEEGPSGYRRWVYSGWLFKNQGWVMVW